MAKSAHQRNKRQRKKPRQQVFLALNFFFAYALKFTNPPVNGEHLHAYGKTRYLQSTMSSLVESARRTKQRTQIKLNKNERNKIQK